MLDLQSAGRWFKSCPSTLPTAERNPEQSVDTCASVAKQYNWVPAVSDALQLGK